MVTLLTRVVTIVTTVVTVVPIVMTRVTMMVNMVVFVMVGELFMCARLCKRDCDIIVLKRACCLPARHCTRTRNGPPC